jgi:hypothetical protein
MQEREEALGQRKRFGQMLYAANEDRDFMRAQFARLVGAAPGITELILRLRRTGPARPGRRLMRGRTFRPTAVVGWKCQWSSSTGRGPQRSEHTRRAGAEHRP